MSIPKFNYFHRPILEYLSQVDRIHRTDKNLISAVQKKLNVSDEDMKEKLPVTLKSRFLDRVGWSLIYMKKAGLISLVKGNKGVYEITERGKKELEDWQKNNLHYIDNSILSKYESFRDFKNKKNPKDIKSIDKADEPTEETLDESIVSIHLEINNKLKEDLLEKIFESHYFFFEKLVIDLLINLGYGGSRQEAGQSFQTTKDEGVDGTIYEDKLGLDLIHVQAKRWKSSVGRPEIQKFAGALQGKRVKKGVFITTSSFSKEAREFAKGLECKIILIDGEQLTDFMIDSNTGIVVENIFEVKKINEDYFDETG